MASFNRWSGLSIVFLLGLVFLGCTQPPSQVLSSPSAPASPSATTWVKPAASPTVSAPIIPSASATLGIAHIPSLKPSVLPTDEPVPSVPAGIPALVDFVHSMNRATDHAFNDSRLAYVTSENVWVVDHTFPDYQYWVSIRPSKTRNWSALDVVRVVNGISGVAKNVSLVEGESGPFYKYDLTMKCYDAHFDVQVVVMDFIRVPDGTQYRRTLGPAVMLTMADACPN